MILGEDGAAGSKGRWSQQLGGIAGMEGALAAGMERMEGQRCRGTHAWSPAAVSQTFLTFLVSVPREHLGGWAKP